MDNIERRVQRFGKEFVTKCGGNMEEECERELEKEIELEQVVERQIAAQESRDEVDWDARALLTTTHPLQLPSSNLISGSQILQVKKLSDFIGNNIFFEGEPSMKRKLNVDWPSNVFATSNFIHACAGDNNTRFSVNDYFRAIDAYLVFRDGAVLLLSERECDKVLELSWTMPKSDTFTLVHWTYARKGPRTGSRISLQSPPPAAGGSHQVSGKVLAALDLLQGEVMFPDSDVMNSVVEMLSSHSAKLFAPLFCSMRGLGFRYSRSDLEVICTSLAFDEQ